MTQIPSKRTTQIPSKRTSERFRSHWKTPEYIFHRNISIVNGANMLNTILACLVQQLWILVSLQIATIVKCANKVWSTPWISQTFYQCGYYSTIKYNLLTKTINTGNKFVIYYQRLVAKLQMHWYQNFWVKRFISNGGMYLFVKISSIYIAS